MHKAEELFPSLTRRGFQVRFKNGNLQVTPFAKLSSDQRYSD
jgi:hypothetical protein